MYHDSDFEDEYEHKLAVELKQFVEKRHSLETSFKV